MQAESLLNPDAQKIADAAWWSNLFQHAYTLYFALFALGALLLLLSVLLPRWSAASPGEGAAPRIDRGRTGVIGGILLLLLCAISQQTNIDQGRGFIADQEKRLEKAIRELSLKKNKEEVLKSQYLYMPEGDSLTVMSLNNPGIAADYVWLTSLQYVSSAFRRGNKFEMLSRFYNTMIDLDPHWIESAVNGGKVLSALEPDRFAVERFYIKAVVDNPSNNQLYYEAGRLFVVPPQNPKDQKLYSDRAVGWFQRLLTKLKSGAQTPTTAKEISEVEDMIARLGLEAGYYKAAAELLLKRATDPRNPSAMRSLAAIDWLNAHSLTIVNELEDKVDAYKKEHGTFPPGLDDLLKLMPENGERHRRDAYGFLIEYDASKGTVSSRGVQARRALQAANVMESLIVAFKGSKNRYPFDMTELREFTRFYFSNPLTPPSAVVIEAIGEDLDTAHCPIGAWDYDPGTGQIKLPPYTDPKVLFRNSEKLYKPE